MNPTEDGLFCDDLPYRQIYCRYYDLCLDHACEKDWCNFHCKACSAFEPLQLTQEDRDANVNRCFDLLHEIVDRAA